MAPGGIDWDAARARLARLAEEAEKGSTASREAEAALLDARARALSRPLSEERDPTTLREVIRFRSSGQEYAMDTRFVLEVVRAPEWVPLPGAPPELRGLALLHGEVLPVVELAPLFERAVSGTGGSMLVVGAGRPELGLRTEEVREVMMLATDELLPPPATLDSPLIAAAHRDGTLLLEAEALLSDSRLVFELSDEGI